MEKLRKNAGRSESGEARQGERNAPPITVTTRCCDAILSGSLRHRLGALFNRGELLSRLSALRIVATSVTAR